MWNIMPHMRRVCSVSCLSALENQPEYALVTNKPAKNKQTKRWESLHGLQHAMSEVVLAARAGFREEELCSVGPHTKRQMRKGDPWMATFKFQRSGLICSGLICPYPEDTTMVCRLNHL